MRRFTLRAESRGVVLTVAACGAMSGLGRLRGAICVGVGVWRSGVTGVMWGRVADHNPSIYTEKTERVREYSTPQGRRESETQRDARRDREKPRAEQRATMSATSGQRRRLVRS